MGAGRVEKKRIDLVLVEQGLFETRERARRAVMAGMVFIGTERVVKASCPVRPEQEALITVKTRDPAISRAYYKLQRALDLFGVGVSGRIAIDVGSSTGGFTQLLLERGARLVWAVDCGTNQLHYSLRRDPRVRVMEKTNARFLERASFEPDLPELAVMDVSFISATLILPVLAGPLGISEIVLLVKPQFEAGRHDVGAGGIVRDPAVHRDVLERVMACLVGLDLIPAGLSHSPLTGGDGNIEYLLRALRNGLPGTEAGAGGPPDIAAVVAAAHTALGSKEGV